MTDLGDVLELGELECDAEAAEEDGDERAGVAEGREAELAVAVLDDTGQLLEGLGHGGQRGGRLPERGLGGGRAAAEFLRHYDPQSSSGIEIHDDRNHHKIGFLSEY